MGANQQLMMSHKASSGSITITRISSSVTTNSTSSSSTIATPAFNAASGNLIVVGVAWGVNDGATDVTLSDTAGNTYTKVGTVTFNESSQSRITLFYRLSSAAQTSNIVTATFTTNVSFPAGIYAVQYNASSGSWSYDATGTVSASGNYATNPLTSASFSTAGAGVMSMFAANHYYTNTNTSSFTGETNLTAATHPSVIWAAERINSSAQSSTTVSATVSAGDTRLGLWSGSFTAA